MLPRWPRPQRNLIYRSRLAEQFNQSRRGFLFPLVSLSLSLSLAPSPLHTRGRLRVLIPSRFSFHPTTIECWRIKLPALSAIRFSISPHESWHSPPPPPPPPGGVHPPPPPPSYPSPSSPVRYNIQLDSFTSGLKRESRRPSHSPFDRGFRSRHVSSRVFLLPQYDSITLLKCIPSEGLA